MNYEGLNGLWNVLFGFEYVIAQFFWNTLFITATFIFLRRVVTKQIHGYMQEKYVKELEEKANVNTD
jgi:hypothetical protein